MNLANRTRDPLTRRVAALAVLAAAGAGLVAVAGPLTPPAGPVAQTYKTLTEIEPRTNIATVAGSAAVRHVITQPGSYYLSANISGLVSLSGIVVQADNVVIDLNGFSILGVLTSVDGIQLSGARTNVTIRNGVIRGWTGEGIDAVDDTNVHVSDVVLSGNGSDGIATGPGCIVSRCASANNGGDGFQMGEGSAIDHCTANGNTSTGIRTLPAGGSSNAGGTLVTACNATQNNGDGIVIVNGAANGCVANYNTLNGINAVNSTVTDSETRGNGVNGFAGGSAVFRGCTTRSNTGDGFNVSEGTLIDSCVARGNLGDGIEVSREGNVRGNHCEDNGLSGTGVGIRVLGINSRIDSNCCTNNIDAGILVPAGATANSIHRNAASGNFPNYSIVAGNDTGPIGTAAAATSPWANLQF